MSPRKPAILLPLLAAAALVSALPSQASADLDEVVVRADRNQLQQMREEILVLEESFYDRFNELNTDRDFQMQCSDTARTGTNFRKKVCRPRFANEAMGDEGRAWLDGIKSASSGAAQTGPVFQARPIIERKNQQLMARMVELVRKDPDLQETLIRYGDLKKKYSAALKGRESETR